MQKRYARQGGFTLVELMITIVIVGILASVAIPLYKGYTKRAIASEADAALGAIRTALRVYYAENNAYPNYSGWRRVPTIGVDVTTEDLTGKYFTERDYRYRKAGRGYVVRATGRGKAAGIKRQIDHNGKLGNF